ncbi:MAG: phage major capsid protein [Ruminococcus sp.]|nr:phage major capsid protein [Ruminococcus sp.]
MKNLDFLAKEKLEFAKNLREAIDAKDDEKIYQSFEAYAEKTEQSLIAIAEEYAQTSDSAVLASRGIRQLTTEEKAFYDDISAAFKSGNPKAALEGGEKTFPITIISSVIEDIQATHPLLAAIDLQNTTASTKWIFNDGSVPLATWDKLTSAITEEMSAAINAVDFDLTKLTAFIPIPKDLLDYGAIYLDAYVRAILGEASANGLEYGFLKGTGKNQPIGSARNLSTTNDGVYPFKEKEVLNSFSPEDYCAAIAKLAKRPNGSTRVIFEVALIVNPVDYINKVIPGTTVLAADGTYKNGSFPFPTRVFPSGQLLEGEAILGIMENGKLVYKAFFAGALSKIEYSDDAHFLEDERVFKSKTYAYGRPVDNTSFLYLDISNIKPAALKFKLVDSSSGAESYAYIPVSEPTGNPSEQGYYELIGNAMTLSEDTEVDSEKTYYTRITVEA